MGMPSVVYGDFGDEKTAQSTAINGFPLGIKMVLPDGREFVHAKAATAAALGIGQIMVSKAVAGTSVNVVASSATVVPSIGATTIVLTMPATTLCTVVNQYADGYVAISDTTGEGHTYKIKTSSTAAAASTATFTLYPNDKLKVALAGASSECTIHESEYYDVLARAAGTTAVGVLAGVPNVAVSAGFYCWLQKRGVATVLCSGTIGVAGSYIAAATTEAGFQAFIDGANTSLHPANVPLGQAMVTAAASTEYSLVFLSLP
jgi:hypothetical protein